MAFELMNTQEIHEFGLQVLLQYLTEKGFEIEFVQPNKSEIPHVVAKQGEQLIFILVATDVYPNKGTIADSDKQALLEHPGFTGAAKPDIAIPLYEKFMAECAARGFTVQHGEFGADMQVFSQNDGPVTILLDTDQM